MTGEYEPEDPEPGDWVFTAFWVALIVAAIGASLIWGE